MYVKNTCLSILVTETNKPIRISYGIAQYIYMADCMISTCYPLLR